MATASNFMIYRSFKDQLGLGAVDLVSASFRLRLATAAYVPNLDTDVSASAAFAFLSAAAGQTSAASAFLLASVEYTTVAAGTMMFNFADVVITASDATSARYAVVYHGGTNQLVGYMALDRSADTTIDLVFTQLTLQINANGMFRLSGGTSATA